jgi:hypothetical protein
MPPTTSLAARRGQNHESSRRVTFSETNTTSSRLYESEEEEEEELERAMSERYGEAEEAGGGERKRKKEESDKDIEKELEQEEKKKQKKPRPQLLPSHLMSAEGLIRLPVEFKRIKYRPMKGKKRDVGAAAAYVQNLMNAYRSFCTDLFPSMAFEDVLLKIEQLGSKKDVKSFLQSMRDDVRNKHLEELYGKEKAERMLQELDEGLKQSQADFDDGEDMHVQQQQLTDHPATTEDEAASSASTTAAASTRDDDNSNNIAPNTSVVSPTATGKDDSEKQPSDAEGEEQEASFDDQSPVKGSLTPSKQVDSDDDDEEEATFEDVSAAPRTRNDAIATQETSTYTTENDANKNDEGSDERVNTTNTDDERFFNETSVLDSSETENNLDSSKHQPKERVDIEPSDGATIEKADDISDGHKRSDTMEVDASVDAKADGLAADRNTNDIPAIDEKADGSSEGKERKDSVEMDASVDATAAGPTGDDQ